METTVWINARFLPRPVTGVERVARELITALCDRLNDEGAWTGPQGLRLNFRLITPGADQTPSPWPKLPVDRVGCGGGHLWEQTSLLAATRSGWLLSLCNTGPMLKRRQVLFMHDAQTFAIPGNFTWRFRLWYRLLFTVAGRISSAILTNSSYSREELVKRVGLDPSSITATWLGVEHVLREVPDEAAFARHALPADGGYLLAVSSNNPNKNFAAVLKALQLLGQEAPPCVIAGHHDARIFGELPAGDSRIIPVGHVTDAELHALYARAIALLFPSYYEGFGLPPVEAMALGCPAIVSSTSVMPEICGDAALYCDPAIPETLAAAIRRLHLEPSLRQRLIARGRERVQLFSWANCAEAALQSLAREVRTRQRQAGVIEAPTRPSKPPARPTPPPGTDNIILAHDYLIQMGGAERLFASLHRAWPQAPIFVSATDYEHLLPGFEDAHIHNTWMQNVPGMNRHHKSLFPLYPMAFRSFGKLDGAAAVVSSSGFSKWLRFTPRTRVFCYCHTPPRFFWQTDHYLKNELGSRLLKMLARLFILWLRPADHACAQRVHHFIANSETVRRRIKDFYGRESVVIHPPVEVERFRPTADHDGYYLILSRLVSYKGVDRAIAAFLESGRHLVIAGSGPDRGRLERLARGAVNIEFHGRVDEARAVRLVERCRAFVLPGTEDFGITPLEAQAAGKPVLAYADGGALETVVEGQTGCLFTDPSPAGINRVASLLEATPWDPAAIRHHAEKFAEPRFIQAMQQYVDEQLHEPVPLIKEPHPPAIRS